MRAKPFRWNRGALLPVGQLLLALASAASCGQEPVILFDIAAWPAGAERILVRPNFNGTVNANILIEPSQSRFAVRVPAGSAGMVALDVVGLDAMSCKLAAGSLTVPLPDNLNHFLEQTLTLSLLPAPVCGAFATATNYQVGVKPTAVVLGDFNGDKKPDLAAVNYGGTTVSVLLGNASNGFVANTDFPAGIAPYSMAVGDFDGDKKTDLVVADYGNSNASVLLGNGSGGFGTATYFTIDKSAVSVAVGDVNGN